MNKILVISHLFPDFSNPVKGIFVLKQLEAMRRKNVNFIVVAPRPYIPPFLSVFPKFKKRRDIPKYREVDSEMPVFYLRYLSLSNFLVWGSGYFLFYSLRNWALREISSDEVVLIHAHTSLPDGYAASILADKWQVPFILTVHGSDVLIYPFRNKLIFKATQKVLEKADRIIAVSKNLKSVMVSNFNIYPNKIVVIRNGFDVRYFYFDNIHKNRDTIIFVGELSESKGVFELVESIKALAGIIRRRKFKVKFIGMGKDESKLRQKIIDYSLGDIVELLGRMSHSQIGDYIRRSKLLVLPSWSEGFPTVIPEALACGTPVIASWVGGIPEILNSERVGILVSPKNVNELITALKKGMEKKWDHEYIANYAMDLSWDHITDKIIQVYKEVLNEKLT